MLRLLVVSVFLVATVSSAQPVSSEIAQRFERALRLFGQGNQEQALLEFQKLYAETQKPAALFNVALVQAALNHPVQAIEAADLLFANPGSFAPARLAHLKTVREAQLGRVGELYVRAPEGANVSISGRKLGNAPIEKPILVPAGRVIVAGQASRRKPGFVEAEITPRRRTDVVLELAPLDAQLGSVKLSTRLPGAEVFVDGVKVGTTPELTRVPVEPGERVIELRRDGYQTASTTVKVGEAAEIAVTLDPKEDLEATASDGATVSVMTSETQVLYSVDGKRMGLVMGTFKLSPGQHALIFERGGFYPVTRTVSVAARELLTINLSFEPTPDFRAETERSIFMHRLLGIGGLVVGAIGIGGGAGYLAYNGGVRDVWQARVNTYGSVEQVSMGCPDELGQTRDCGALKSQAADKVRQTQQLDLLGYTALGVGGLFAVAGLVSLVTTPSLAQYDLMPDTGALSPSLSIGPFGAGLMLNGRF